MSVAEDAILADVTQICQTFPDAVTPEVNRDQVIKSIDDHFDSGGTVAILKGASGFGKTILLSQLARHHRHTSISLFVSGANKWTYNFDVCLFDLYNQIHWLLEGVEVRQDTHVDEPTFTRILLKLRNAARRDHRPYYFLLDGLDQVPDEALNTRDRLLELMGWDHSQFRFVISSSPDCVSTITRAVRENGLQIFPVYGFSMEETKTVLDGLGLAGSQVADIAQACRCIPRFLGRARRLLATTTSDTDKVIEVVQTFRKGFIEMDWQAVSGDEALRNVVGHVVFDRRCRTVDQLAAVAGFQHDDLRKRLGDLPFLRVDGVTGVVRLDNVEEKQSLVGFLAPYEESIRSSIASSMLAGSIDNPDDAYYLPDALREAGRYADILDRLSPENLGPLIDRAHSLVPIQRMTQAGLEAADKLDSVNGILQLSLCAAAIRQALQTDATKEHVAAHASLGNWDQALAIAEGSRTKEEKLHCLSVILAAQKDQSLPADDHLLNRIRVLSTEVDTAALGSLSAEIAGNIIDSLPDVAAAILRDIEKLGARSQEADMRLASVALRRSIDAADVKPTNHSIIDKVYAQVSDTDARSYLLGFKALTSRKTAEQILSEVETIEDVGLKIVLGVNWLRTHFRQPDAANVALSLLDTIIAATGVTPDAQLYHDLALPLPHVSLSAEREVLLEKLSVQATTVEKRGPTEAYVQLLALICQGYCIEDSPLGVARLEELVAYVQALSDAATRSACWASVLQAASRMQHGDSAGRARSIAEQAGFELQATVDLVLAQSADHLVALRNCLRVLAGYDADRAIQIAKTLNTQARRDTSLHLILTALNDRMVNKEDVPWAQVWQALDLIVDDVTRADALLGLLTLLPIFQPELPPECLQQIALRVSRVPDAILKARCCVKLLAYRHWASLANGPLRHRHDLFDAVNCALDTLTGDWERMRAALRIAAELRPYSTTESDQMLARAEEIRSQCSTANEQASDAYAMLASLLGRALVGLLHTDSLEEKDFDRVRVIVTRLADPLRRFGVWAHIALRLGDKSTHKRPIIGEMAAIWAHLPDELRRHLLVTEPDALFLLNPADTLDRLGCMEKESRDKALSEIISWYMQQVPSGEPYEHLHGDQYRLTFDDWAHVNPLIQRLETDSWLCQAIRSAGDTFQFKRNLTVQQSEEVSGALNALIKKRLPDPNNIHHEGYAIVAEAEVLRIKQVSGKEWEGLKERAGALQNAADSAFVLTHLAGSRGASKSAWASACVTQAREKLKGIPTVADRVDRCCTAIEIAREFNKELAISLVRQAWADMGLLGSQDTRRLGKTIIDEAYRLDPHLASTLVSSMDDDPVRLRYRKALLAHLRVLKKADSDDIVGRAGDRGSESLEPLVKAVQIRLARLHADKERPANLSETQLLVLRGSEDSLDDVYWLFAYHLENTARKCRSRPVEYKKHLRDLFEGAAAACEIVWRVASRPVSMAPLISSSSGPVGLHVSGNDLEAVKEFIQAWLQRNPADHLLLCDPYFDREDLPFVKWISTVQPATTRITVLGGFPKYTEGALKSVRDIIYDYWRDHVERNSEPPLDLCHTWTTNSHKCPFHYRAIVAGNAALDLGSSVNALGAGRTFNVSELPTSIASEIRREVEDLLKRTNREFEGERLKREFIGY